MKRISLILLGLGLAACNQTTEQATLSPAVPAPGPVVAAAPAPEPVSAPVVAQDDLQSLPPIYTPLVDMHRKSQARYQRDHAECRKLAEPQERAAREAMKQQQAGTALAVAGAMAGFIPVRGFSQAVNVANASNAAQDLGGSIAAGGAAQNAAATDDYALVVNACLSRRGYVLLRA